MSSYLQVATTVETRVQAESVARHVLEERLAGCVQIMKCQSMYRWQGKIEHGDEYLCIMKTREDLFTLLQDAISSIHPYEVPEILATPVPLGSPRYLSWLDEELRTI